jgi:hypothetical protein
MYSLINQKIKDHWNKHLPESKTVLNNVVLKIRIFTAI